MSNAGDLRARQIADVIRCGHLAQLAECAVRRHGFGNSDVGFGVIYPGDLDDDEAEAAPIPPGFVQIYGFWGEAFEFVIEEGAYLAVLAKTLRENGMVAEAERVGTIAQRATAEGEKGP